MDQTGKSNELICKKCGSIDDYEIRNAGPHHTAYCNGCGAYIKHVAVNEPQFYFGKYKGELVSEITDKQYLEWCLGAVKLSKVMQDAVMERIADL
jgi:hypothetical protein